MSRNLHVRLWRKRKFLSCVNNENSREFRLHMFSTSSLFSSSWYQSKLSSFSLSLTSSQWPIDDVDTILLHVGHRWLLKFFYYLSIRYTGPLSESREMKSVKKRIIESQFHSRTMRRAVIGLRWRCEKNAAKVKSFNCPSNWPLQQHHNRDDLLLPYYDGWASKTDGLPLRPEKFSVVHSFLVSSADDDYHNPFQTLSHQLQFDMNLALAHDDCMLWRSSQSPSSLSSTSRRIQLRCWALIWSRQFHSRLVAIESSAMPLLRVQFRYVIVDDASFHRTSIACTRCGNIRQSVSKRSCYSMKWCQEERNHEKVMQTYRMSTQTYRARWVQKIREENCFFLNVIIMMNKHTNCK